MTIYSDAPAFYRVMEQLFRRAIADPVVAEALGNTNVIVRLAVSDPDAELTLDARSAPIQMHQGPTLQRPDVTLALPCDILHRVWLSEISLREAYFGGQIKVDGSPLQMLRLVPQLERLFRAVESLYPSVIGEVIPSASSPT